MLLCSQYIVPVTSDPIENGAILVQNNKIVDIGSADMMRLRYPNEEIRDFGMAALSPGFIDLRAHMEDAVLRGLVPDLPYVAWVKKMDQLRERVSRDAQFDSAYFGGLGSISSGITTVSDTTTSGACVRAAQMLGLRGVFFRETSAIDKRLVDYAIKKTDSALEKWAQNIDADRIKLGVAPSPTFKCHPEMYRRVVHYVTEQGDLPIAMHLAGSYEEYRFVKYGAAVGSEERSDLHGFMEIPPWLPTQVTPVNYVLNWGGFDAKNVMIVHGIQVNEEDIAKLKEYDVGVAICPSFTSQLGMGVAPVGEFLRSGLRVGLGTNAPAALDFVDLFTEMRVLLLLQRAITRGEFITAQTLMEMGTIRAAQVLRLEDKIGSLEAGKLADIIAIDLSGSHQSPATDLVSAILSSAGDSDIMMTMVDGKILFERGHWHVNGEVAKNVARVLELRTKLRV